MKWNFTLMIFFMNLENFVKKQMLSKIFIKIQMLFKKKKLLRFIKIDNNINQLIE